MKPLARSVEKIIDAQVRKWTLAGRDAKESAPKRPVIVVSRQPGSGGQLLARRLADALRLDLFDREIIEKVAKSARMSTAVVQALDERGRLFVEEWVSTAVTKRQLLPDEYLRHLMRVIGAIGRHGGAVIIGRGAGFILPPAERFVVRVIAPLDVRVRNSAQWLNISEGEARKRLIQTDENRKAFIRKYFHADIDDPIHYDLVVNTWKVSVDDAAGAVKMILKSG